MAAAQPPRYSRKSGGVHARGGGNNSGAAALVQQYGFTRLEILVRPQTCLVPVQNGAADRHDPLSRAASARAMGVRV